MTNLTLVDNDTYASQDGEVVTVAPIPGRDHSMYDEKSPFTSRQVPWMKLGTVIDRDVDATEAARLGGLDFEVELIPAGCSFNKGKSYKRVPDRFAIVRKDTEEWFNWASSEYGVVQYSEAFNFLNEINPKFVAAGALRGGRVGFMVIQHPNVDDLSGLELNGVGDPHEFFVVVRTSQDMSYSVEISLMTLRGRCMNELTLPSFTRNAPHRWSLRHSKNVRDRMHDAKVVLTRSNAYVDEFTKIARRLADIDVDFETAKQTLSYVLPDRPRRDKQIEEILGVYEGSSTNGFQGTGWGLTNAVSEYFEWERPRRQSDMTQLINVLDGTTHQRVAKTAQVLLATAN
jgi:phage/plasmid-like protein (TIGR03299 family)